MPVEQRSTYDDSGAYVRIVEFTDEDNAYDRVVIRAPPNDDNLLVVEGYNGDELQYKQSFEMRELSFDPISAIGRGQTDKLTGTTPNDTTDTDNIPGGVQTALNGLGMAVVPDGEWWLNG